MGSILAAEALRGVNFNAGCIEGSFVNGTELLEVGLHSQIFTIIGLHRIKVIPGRIHTFLIALLVWVPFSLQVMGHWIHSNVFLIRPE